MQLLIENNKFFVNFGMDIWKYYEIIHENL